MGVKKNIPGRAEAASDYGFEAVLERCGFKPLPKGKSQLAAILGVTTHALEKWDGVVHKNHRATVDRYVADLENPRAPASQGRAVQYSESVTGGLVVREGVAYIPQDLAIQLSPEQLEAIIRTSRSVPPEQRSGAPPPNPPVARAGDLGGSSAIPKDQGAATTRAITQPESKGVREIPRENYPTKGDPQPEQSE